MRRTITDIKVEDVEKRKIPSKHYVYVIYVTWSDSSTNIIYRRYSRFFDFQSEIMDMFPEESGMIDPEKRIVPFLPGKKFFGRSHIREVAVKRLGPIADYCKQLLKLPKKISECDEVLEFFELEPEDINPPKGKKASMKAKKISNPKPLEVFIAVADYKKQEKGEISLQVGCLVEVVEKTETGWWFVNVEEEQGWVPSTCLEREDGTKEESTVIFRPGEEEQYLCTEEFKGQSEDEISMDRGAVVDVLEKNLEGWWRVRYNGKEGYAPATYLMKCEGFKIHKQKAKVPVQKTLSTAGPQIVKSLHEVSDLLNEEGDTPSNNNINTEDNQADDEFDDNYELPDEDKIYSINELSKILKEDNRGSMETDQIYESIQAMKSRSLKRHGSIRPPPRPSVQPKVKRKSPLAGKPVLERLMSQQKDYVTICDFTNGVGDGITFKAGQHVKVLEKSETGWWFIEFDNKEGWAPASYIESCSSGQETPKLTVDVNKQRPKSPVPTSPLPKSPLSKSRDDLSAVQDERPSSPKRQSSSMGDLANALKSRLKPKGQGPPAPPKKDFLDEETSQRSSGITKSQNDIPGSERSITVPVKPGGVSKPLNRNMMAAPPPPPPPSKPTSKGEIVESLTKNRPVTPTKPKSTDKPKSSGTAADNSNKFSSTEISSKTNEEDGQPGKLNVSGLAGALKARFEGLESDKSKPEPPGLNQKPKPETSSKPTLKPVTSKTDAPKPDINFKPVLKPVQKKPDVPPVVNKAKDTSKPAPFNKPNVGLKPNAPSNKPSWVKSDNETKVNEKPSWAKPENKNRTNEKPSWIKSDNQLKTKDNTTDDSGSAPKVSDLASVLKAKFETRTSTLVESNTQSSPPPKPKTIGKPSGQTERPQNPLNSTKPPGSVPKPPSKPRDMGRSSSPMNTNQIIDPNKYSSRPLPAKPPGGTKTTEDLDNIHDKKPLPAVPGKPRGAVSSKIGDTTSDSDEDKPKAVGVSGLANALKAKLGGMSSDVDISTKNAKPTPPKPTKPKVTENKFSNTASNSNASLNIDQKNNNTQVVQNSDNKYKAIADHVAGNDGEISLSVDMEVELLEKADGWWYVCTDSAEGWAPSAYLEKVKSKGTRDTKPLAGSQAPKPKTAVFRTCSDFEAEHEGELSVARGQTVSVVNKDDGGWWLVSVKGEEGWIPAAYLEEV